MKYIIMAAGVGSRISKDIKQIPKCLLIVKDKKSIIEIKIEKLISSGCSPDDIAIVVGYRANVVQDVVKKYNIHVYYNPFYRITNSIASIWFARNFIDSNFIAMNGDLFFDEGLLEKLTAEKNKEFVMLCDSSRVLEADYRFYCRNNELKAYGKDLPIEKTTGEYVGIGMISGNGVEKFINDLNKMIDNEQYNCWWEDVIYQMVNTDTINVLDINGHFWGEVDYVEDYERIINHVQS